ncbi:MULTISPECIES: aminotransferase class IV [unclassified Thalassospira]|uniref:aminotransferase class IV n=1 Tax=unclassified Thalassospira TaxID=2648997 RepID=UPI000A1E0B02|nr:aminotransferase class IV [Thalassospira sp. MCCC 1A01428]
MLWLNGSFYTVNPAQISVSDRGFLLGDGVFETMRARHGQVGWLSSHLERISRSIDIIGGVSVSLPSKTQMAEIIATLCQTFSNPHGVIRLTISRGQGGQGLLPAGASEPVVLITAKPFDLEGGKKPVTLAVSKRVRRNPWSVASQIKSLNYLDNIIARQEAANAGAEDCLIMTQDGYVGETTIANIFVLINGQLCTAAKQSGIFAGLARDFVIDWAQRNDIAICYDPLTIGDLKAAEYVIVCNALRGIRAVSSVEGEMLVQSEYGRDLHKKLSSALEMSVRG